MRAPAKLALATRLPNGNDIVAPIEKLGASLRKMFESERLNPPARNVGVPGMITFGTFIVAPGFRFRIVCKRNALAFVLGSPNINGTIVSLVVAGFRDKPCSEKFVFRSICGLVWFLKYRMLISFISRSIFNRRSS